MARYGLLVDMDRCNGCYGCFLACRDEFCGNDYPPYSAAQPYSGHSWMRIVERERGNFPKVKMAYIRIPCMQCDDPVCVKQAPDSAVYKRPDGIIIIDPVKAKGHKEIVASCPYRVIYWNEELQLPQKCTFCVHLLEQGWKEPRCVEFCPTNALVFGDLDDPKSEISQRLAVEKAEPLRSEFGMKEKVLYLNMPRRFISGSVVFGDIDKCAENVIVNLMGDGEEQTTRTNNYGDFEFEGLPKNKDYIVQISYKGYEPKELKTNTKIDVHLGDIVLSKATR